MPKKRAAEAHIPIFLVYQKSAASNNITTIMTNASLLVKIFKKRKKNNANNFIETVIKAIFG